MELLKKFSKEKDEEGRVVSSIISESVITVYA